MTKNMEYTPERITDLYNKYVDMVYRICFMFFKNEIDTEDAVQAIFMKVIEKEPTFASVEHEKAWLIVTAQNHCKNQLKHWWQKRIEFDSATHDSVHHDEESGVLELVLKLPDKFKLPIYLHYYEGYSTDEIAQMLDVNASTLRSRLKKGRELLKLGIGGEGDE
ncbi:RNA polymerase sigma factor [Niameybacter massiliensis]|uniref:RNA polymerase sigma factor n=1 Tax=Niameybacter massiliensis TaxID=1658108 RepID=UPI001FA811DF|nr:sigma-70 family RNA polymerase sigma factor [Niameybacter massiliensis]